MPPKSKKSNRISPPETRSRNRNRVSVSESSPPPRKPSKAKRRNQSKSERSASRSPSPQKRQKKDARQREQSSNRRQLAELQKQVKEQRQLIDQLLRKSTSANSNEGETSSVLRISPLLSNSHRPVYERLGPAVQLSPNVTQPVTSVVSIESNLLPTVPAPLQIKLADLREHVNLSDLLPRNLAGSSAYLTRVSIDPQTADQTFTPHSTSKQKISSFPSWCRA